MEFNEMRKMLQENFARMTATATHLFDLSDDKDELWNLYLDSFPEGKNKMFRERREHDCSCCRHFIKNIGGVAVIENNVVKTIWDFMTNDDEYQSSITALSNLLKTKSVVDVYYTKVNRIGIDKNYELLENGKTREWTHFFLDLPSKFVDKTGKSEGEYKGYYRDIKNVFQRSLEEISQDSVETVLELIAQNSLYKGDEWKTILASFLVYKKQYAKLNNQRDKDNYAWEYSIKAGSVIGKIRNHSIGTLLVNISEGMDLDLAVKKYEVIVAPANYKRPKAIFTQKMLDDAKKAIEDLGYFASLGRRYATLDDITVNNILFSNKDAAKRIVGADVFAEMSKAVGGKPNKFTKVEEISADDFVSGVLPTAREVEVYFENKHSNNMVSLIAPQDKTSPSMFKWNNGFSWAYAGNITDSTMKENVKSAGGKVDGDLRFSIQWNDIETDLCDLDAHCIEPQGYEIYYGNKMLLSPMRGVLDVDIIRPQAGKAAVENITYASRKTMKNGTYRLFVRQFSGSAKRGFRAEVEFDGQVYSFDYDKTMRSGQDVEVAIVTLTDGVFTISEKIPSALATRDIWGLATNQFVPVTVSMYSPNYWDEQQGVGHKHYFFMLKGCNNPERPNGFYNEFLKHELEQHKRVFEALGSKMAVQDVEDQLSGLGFSSTKRNELVVKVKGATERVLKIKF